MKKIAFAVTLILALFLLVLAETQLVNFAGANPDPYKMGYKKQRHCNITIQYPQDMTCYLEPVLLNFTVKKVYVSDTYSYFYILDEQDLQSGVKVEEIQLVGQETITNDTFFPYTVDTLRGDAALPNLHDGPHNLTVFIGWKREDGMIFHANIDPFSATAHFSVNTTTLTPSPSPSPQETETAPQPFSTTPPATGIVSVCVVSVSLLVYFKKRNRKC